MYVFSLERAVPGSGDELDTKGQHKSDDGGSDYMNIHTYEAVLPGQTSKQLLSKLITLFSLIFALAICGSHLHYV